VFYRPGTATARAVQCIYDALELEADATDYHAHVMSSTPAGLSSSRTVHHV
jgi:hypothetical protein